MNVNLRFEDALSDDQKNSVPCTFPGSTDLREKLRWAKKHVFKDGKKIPVNKILREVAWAIVDMAETKRNCEKAEEAAK